MVFHISLKNETTGLMTFPLNHSPTVENSSQIAFQLSFTTTTIVATAATIAPTITAGNAATPANIAPIVANATPITIKISFTQLNPSFSILTKFTIDKIVPAIAEKAEPIVANRSTAPVPNAAVIASPKLKPLNNPSMSNPRLVDNEAKIVLNACIIAVPMPAPSTSSNPIFEAIACAIAFDNDFPIKARAAEPNFNEIIFFISNVPTIISTVLMSKLLKKSVIPLSMSFRDKFLASVISAVYIPCTHALIVFASNAKSKFSKNPLMPLAIDKPKLVQSNVVPNELRKCKAVFSEPAIVAPKS